MIKEPEICTISQEQQTNLIFTKPSGRTNSLKELSTRRVLHDDSEMGRSQNHLGIQNPK